MEINEKLVQELQQENQDLHEADQANTDLILKLTADIDELKRTISQYEQPVPEINMIEGVRNILIDEAE